MNNTFPFQSSNIKSSKPVLPDNNIFKRDDRLEKAINRHIDTNKQNPIINIFNNPVNSNDLSESKNYKSFKKEELKDKYIHDIYNMMSDTVSEIITQDEIERIQGIYPSDIDSSIKSLYKPVHSSIDISTNNYTFNNIPIDAKYKPYENINLHKFGK